MEHQSDDPANLHALQALRQRVSELSSKYTPQSPAVSFPSSMATAVHDPFADQLHDILRRLSCVEQSIAHHRRAVQPSYGGGPSLMPYPAAAECAETMMYRKSVPGLNHDDNMCLQKYMILDHYIKDLERRFNQAQEETRDTLESHDDRLDGLDPNRFTPATSTTGTTAEVYETKIASRHASGRDFPFSQPPPTVCELYSDAGQSHGPQLTSLSNELRRSAPGLYYTDAWPDPGSYGRPLSQSPTLPPPPVPLETSVRANIERLNEQNDRLTDQLSKLDQDNANLLQLVQNAILRAERPSRVAESSGLEKCPWVLPHPVAKGAHCVSPEGVDFRDRELGRMDEMLTVAHNKLKVSEDSIAEKDVHIASLDDELEEAREHFSRQNKVNREKLAGKDIEISDLREELSSWQNATNRWQDSWHQMDEDLRHWRAKAIAAQRYLHDFADEQRAERNKIMAEHETKVQSFNDFTREKDKVINKQQESIAWAGRLLEQRDGELEGMQKKLKLLEADKDDALRTASRFGRLLNERDKELAYINRKEGESGRSDVVEVDGESTGWPFPAAPLPGLVIREDNKISKGEPSNIADLPKLPSPSPPPPAQLDVWQPHAEEDDNGEPWIWDAKARGFIRRESAAVSMMPPRTNEAHSPSEKRRRGRIGGRHRRPSHRQYPELNRQPVAFETPNVRARGSANTRSNSKDPIPPHRRHPSSEDMSFWPPLPAPVTARRMASEADLRSAYPANTATQKRNHIAKHRSMMDMMDLPQRRLQAYVETEEEEGVGEV